MADKLSTDITPDDLTHEVLTSIEFRFDSATGESLGLVARAAFGIIKDGAFQRHRVVDMAFDRDTAVANLTSDEVAAILSIRRKLKQYARTRV